MLNRRKARAWKLPVGIVLICSLLPGCGGRPALNDVQKALQQLSFQADGKFLLADVPGDGSALQLFGYRIAQAVLNDGTADLVVDGQIRSRMSATIRSVGMDDKRQASDLEEFWLAWVLGDMDSTFRATTAQLVPAALSRIQKLPLASDDASQFWLGQIARRSGGTLKLEPRPCIPGSWRASADAMAAGAQCASGDFSGAEEASKAIDLPPADLLRLDTIARHTGRDELASRPVESYMQRIEANAERYLLPEIDGYTIAVVATLGAQYALEWRNPTLLDYVTFASRALGAAPGSVRVSGNAPYLAREAFKLAGLSSGRLSTRQARIDTDPFSAELRLVMDDARAAETVQRLRAKSKQQSLAPRDFLLLSIQMLRSGSCQILESFSRELLGNSFQVWIRAARTGTMQTLALTLSTFSDCAAFSQNLVDRATVQVEGLRRSAMSLLSTRAVSGSVAAGLAWSVAEVSCIVGRALTEPEKSLLAGPASSYLKYVSTEPLVEGVEVSALFGALRVQQILAMGCDPKPWWTS